MLRTLSLAGVLCLANSVGATVAGECTAAFCQPQAAAATLVAPQQAIALQSIATPAVAVQAVSTPVVAAHVQRVAVQQRVVTLRRAPVRNFLFGRRNVVRVRSTCR